MNPRDFLAQAEEWIDESREVDWRSAVSRAYYAAFLVAREVLTQAGFVVPADANGHAYIWMRLNNCGRAEVVEVGQHLNNLRKSRTDADYRMDHPVEHAEAFRDVDLAAEVIRVLDELTDSDVVLTQVVDAIRVYERDVLKVVTFRTLP